MAFNHPHGSHYYQNVISWLVWSNDSYIQRLCVLSNCKMMSKLHLDKKLGEFLAGCVDWPKAVDRFPEWRFALTTGRSSVWRLKQTAFQTHQKIQFLLLSSRNSFFSTHICSFVESCNLEPKKKKERKKKKISFKCKQLSRSPQLSASSGPLLEIPCSTLVLLLCTHSIVFNSRRQLFPLEKLPYQHQTIDWQRYRLPGECSGIFGS